MHYGSICMIGGCGWVGWLARDYVTRKERVLSTMRQLALADTYARKFISLKQQIINHWQAGLSLDRDFRPLT